MNSEYSPFNKNKKLNKFPKLFDYWTNVHLKLDHTYNKMNERELFLQKQKRKIGEKKSLHEKFKGMTDTRKDETYL